VNRRRGLERLLLYSVVLLLLALVVAVLWPTDYPHPWFYVGFSVVLCGFTASAGTLCAHFLRLPLRPGSIGAVFASLPEVVLALVFWPGVLQPAEFWPNLWLTYERAAHWPGYLVEGLGLGAPHHWTQVAYLANPPFWQVMIDTARVNLVSSVSWAILTGSLAIAVGSLIRRARLAA
jgi:hypothetical protein